MIRSGVAVDALRGIDRATVGPTQPQQQKRRDNHAVKLRGNIKVCERSTRVCGSH